MHHPLLLPEHIYLYEINAKRVNVNKIKLTMLNAPLNSGLEKYKHGLYVIQVENIWSPFRRVIQLTIEILAK